jgi:hypothetical protein
MSIQTIPCEWKLYSVARYATFENINYKKKSNARYKPVPILNGFVCNETGRYKCEWIRVYSNTDDL